MNREWIQSRLTELAQEQRKLEDQVKLLRQRIEAIPHIGNELMDMLKAMDAEPKKIEEAEL